MPIAAFGGGTGSPRRAARRRAGGADGDRRRYADCDQTGRQRSVGLSHPAGRHHREHPDGGQPVDGSTAGASALSSTNALIIVIGAVVILLGISYFIWRDARRRAPGSTTTGTGAEGRARAGTKPPPKPRKLSPAERRRRKRGRAKR